MAGVEVVVENLSKSFGRQNIWSDVTLTLPPGEISVLLGPSGTGKSVFLKSLVGLLKPEKGRIVIHDTDLVRTSESRLYEIRKLFGVLFQDGALFGSMNLFDNIAFPLREHTKKGESDIRSIVMEKMEMVGLQGAEGKLPGEISGGMRKRAGLARALVLDPEIVLFDEPDSGLDPVRTAYLNQLIVDLNAQTDSTFLIVTHDIGTARTLPDNIGMLFRRNLVMFGPREVLLTSEEPVVEQFLNGRRQGPIGMSEEKDTATLEAEAREAEEKGVDTSNQAGGGIVPQLMPSDGSERKAVARRKDRVMRILHELPEGAQHAILESLSDEDRARYGIDRERETVRVGAPAVDGRTGSPASGAPPGDVQHADGQHADGQHADGQQADGQQADGQQADGQQADGQHVDGRHAGGQLASGEVADVPSSGWNRVQQQPPEPEPARRPRSGARRGGDPRWFRKGRS